MFIGIVGKGVVGGATGFAFEKLGHKVIYHDTKLSTSIKDLKDCEVTFICVPTPQKEDGSCDTSIVESVLDELHDTLYRDGIYVIKSTVEPGFTDDMITKFNNNRIVFNPEFLREACAVADAVENVKLLAIGTCDSDAAQAVIRAFGDYPKSVKIMFPLEAELVKYMHNCFNATRIGFANEFYDICRYLGANYNVVKSCLLQTSGVPNMYLDVNENFKGFAGPCLPKDLSAIIALAKKKGIKTRILNAVQSFNNTLKKSVFPGMRLK